MALNRKFTGWDVVIYAVLILLCVACIFPFYYVFIVSFSDPVSLLQHPIYLLPFSFDLSAYRMLFNEGTLLSSALVSVFTTVIATLLSIVITVMAGYALSKKDVPLRKFFLTLVLLAMFIGIQTVPYYIIIRDLKLMNTIWVLIIPLLVDPFYLIIVKNYFLSISPSLEESARIDGANDYTILFRIIVPVSAPLLASVTLFLAVNRWNEWWHAMLFITDKSKWPMQMMLREVLSALDNSSSSNMGQMMMAQKRPMNPQNVRMAAIMITTLPILCVYPFIQKYLTKGLMIGSIKE